MKTTNSLTRFKINGERSRTIKFITLGCKVNQYETQGIRERFLSRGFTEATSQEKADYYLINTCTVTASADQKSRYFIRNSIQRDSRAKIIVTGCLLKKDLASLRKIKGVDLIVDKKFFKQGISKFNAHTRAFLKIQDGCNNFCSYCKVPIVRGVSRSESHNFILKQAEDLVKNGYQEIVLTGICLGDYVGLIDLLSNLEKIDGLLRVRLSSIEPNDVSFALINKIAKSKIICPHLHIPAQSGDDSILGEMNRKYTASFYLGLIRKLKKKIPHIAITTDCMVGFPNETEKCFKNSVKLIKKAEFLKVHIFPYSLRPGTQAAKLSCQVDRNIISRRLQVLRKAAEDSSLRFRNKFIGKEALVLVESFSKDKQAWEGFSENYIKVWVKSTKNLKGQILKVKLRESFLDGMFADKKGTGTSTNSGQVQAQNQDRYKRKFWAGTSVN